MDVARVVISVGSIAGAVGVIGRLLYKRFRRSGAEDIESFRRYATQGIKYYIGRYIRRQLAAELTLRQYARLHLKTTAKTMLVPATYPVHLDVDQVFVPLLLRGAEQDQIAYGDLLDQNGSRILILGEPGSGKSSLLKRSFRDGCRRAASSPRQAQLPILFELRELSRQTDKITRETLMKAFVSILDQSAVYRADQAVEHLSHGAGFLFLLDGLDEVPSQFSADVLDALIDLSNYLKNAAPQSTLIVSSRTQHFLNLQRRDVQETFQTLTIRAFSLGDIYRFLTKWPFKTDARAHVTRIFSRLRQLPSLAEMCTNPLALSMFVARDQQTGGGEQPETRSRFYQAYIQELLVNRRSRREDLPAGRQRLLEARQRLLGEVCLGHLLDSSEATNSIPRSRFVSAIEALNYGGGDADVVLPELSTDTGLFSQEREGETLRFLHLTLCEFLAANEVVERGDDGWGLLGPLLARDRSGSDQPMSYEVRLSELVSFACGLAPRSLRQRILIDLESMAHRQLLLRAAIEGQAYDELSVQRAITAERDDLLAYDPTMWGVDWFARLRLMISVLRDANAGARQELGLQSTYQPSATTLLMQLIDKYHAERQLLGALARQDADTAINIAEKTGRSEVFDLVTTAADDFAVLQGIVARIESGNDTWKVALIQRGLMDRSVANVLHATFAEEKDEDRKDHRVGGWRTCWITKRSIYGQLLDEVLHSPTAWSETGRRLLEPLSKLTPPQSHLRFVLATRLPIVAITMLVISITAAIYYWVSKGTIDLDKVVSSTFVGGLSFALASLSLTVAGWLGRSLRKTRNVREVRFKVVKLSVAGASIELEGRADLEVGRGAVSTGATIPLRREPVLREILNLDSYRFRGLDDGTNSTIVLDGDSAAGPVDTNGSIPGIVYRTIRGVPRAELECLLEVRRHRQKGRLTIAM